MVKKKKSSNMCIIGAIFFTHQWQTGQTCHLTSHIEDTMRNIPPWMALTLEVGASILWKANLQYVFTVSTISSLWTSNPNSLNYCKKNDICAKSLQLCPALCNPTDLSPPDSSVRQILQSRILEWVAMLLSRESSQPRDWTHVSWVFHIGRQVLYH